MLVWVRTQGTTPEKVVGQVEVWKSAKIPVVAIHLDRWFGLSRAQEVYTNPYFRLLDWLFVADPYLEHWQRAGVNAVWSPPAFSERWWEDTEPRQTRWGRPDIVFVGNWHRDSYHPESVHRFEMLDRLTARYGRRFLTLPPRGQPRIIGAELYHLYTSTPIIIGDSCLVGDSSYHSDRVPETLGRGGFLMHPWIDWQGTYTPMEHLVCWRLGDWDGMLGAVDAALDHPDLRGVIAAEGQAHVLANHTYRHRVERLLETVL
jgi:spore maturation protein CgeB